MGRGCMKNNEAVKYEVIKNGMTEKGNIPSIGVIADDVTGAMTTGVLLARSKAKTAVFFNGEGDLKVSGFDAVMVSTGSRAMNPADAYKTVRKVMSGLKNQGIEYFSKRIDTTMRGCIGTEIDAMLDVLGEDAVAVIVPSMPQSRRILVGGFSVIDGKALSETAVAQDVRTPVRESFVPGIISEQGRRKVGQVLLNRIQRGTDEAARAFREARNTDVRLIVADAVTLEHIHIIAEAVWQLGWKVLSVDPGPFTQILNLKRGLIREETDNLPPLIPEEEGKTALVIAGSATSVTERQIRVLCEKDRHYRIGVDPVSLAEGGERAEKEIAHSINRAVELLENQSPRAIVIETALHGIRLDLMESDLLHHYIEGTSSRFLNTGMGRIAEGIVNRFGQKRIAGIYATGGDTLEAVCRQLGILYLEMVDYVIPQADIGRGLIGEKWKIPIIGKGGMTGSDDTAVDIISRLFQENGRQAIDTK